VVVIAKKKIIKVKSINIAYLADILMGYLGVTHNTSFSCVIYSAWNCSGCKF